MKILIIPFFSSNFRIRRRCRHHVTAVGRCQVDVRTDRDDPELINRFVRAVVMVLDVFHVHGWCEAARLVHVLHPVEEIGQVADRDTVALEVNNVHLVVAHDGHEQADVRLRDGAAEQIPVLREEFVELTQTVEEHHRGVVVRRLRLRKPTLVDTIVDALVVGVVHGVDLAAEGLRVQVHLRVACEVVEGCVEEAHDLGALVVDNTFRLFVKQNGNSEPCVDSFALLTELLNGFLINTADVGAAEDGIGGAVTVKLGIEKPSTVVIHVLLRVAPHRRRDGNVNGVLQTLHVAHGKAARGPRAGVGHVEEVATRGGREHPTGFDLVAEDGGLADKVTGFADVSKGSFGGDRHFLCLCCDVMRNQ
eukprot:PhM_4_TR5864/c0_g2_i1/m.19493